MKKIISFFLFLPASCLVTSTTSLSLIRNDNKNNNIIVPQESVFKITNPRNMFNPDDTYQYTASYVDSTSNEDKVIWESSDPEVASIDENGNFTALDDGTVTITATLDSPLKPTDQIEVSIDHTYSKLIFNNMQTKGMTVDCHDMMDNDGLPFYITFVSAQYKQDDTTLSRPIHNELKMSDIEIIFKSEVINSFCSLSSNKLMIPRNFTIDTITINYLGAEIADWISWSDIKSISDKDARDDQREIIKDYFSLGDYKKLYYKGEFYSRARIIDFYHDKYLFSEGEIDVEKPVPTTWEMYEKPFDTGWGCDATFLVYFTRYKVYPWNSKTVTKIRKFCNSVKFDNLHTRECIKISEGNEELKSYDNFFIGSYAEYCGQELHLEKENVRETYKGIDGSLYAYYDINAFISTKTIEARRIRPSSDSGQYYFTRLPWEPNEQGELQQRGDRIILIDGSTGQFAYDEHDVDWDRGTYLMFGI